MDNQNLGRQVFNRSFDPDYVGGWDTRPHNWSLGMSVQHELVPRVSVTAGFHRNSWGNWYVVDNRATSLEDYTPFSIQAPSDPRLPGGGGYTIGGLYNLVPGKVGLVDELAQSSRRFGDQKENWQGFDYSVAARLKMGLTVQGGAATGRKLADGSGEQLRHGQRPRDHATGFPVGDEPLLPLRRTVPNRRPGACRVHDSASGRPACRDVDERTRRVPGGQLRGRQRMDRGRASAARPAAHGGRCGYGEPDRAVHDVCRSPQ